MFSANNLATSKSSLVKDLSQLCSKQQKFSECLRCLQSVQLWFFTVLDP